MAMTIENLAANFMPRLRTNTAEDDWAAAKKDAETAIRLLSTEYGNRHVGINKLRDEMAAAYRRAETSSMRNISLREMLEFINAINSLC